MYRTYLSRTFRPFVFTQRRFFHMPSPMLPRTSGSRFKMVSLAAAAAATSATGLFLSSNTVQAESQVRYQPSTCSTLDDLMNEDNRTALNARTTEELLVGLFVYKLCSMPWLVDLAPHVIRLAESMHMEFFIYAFVKSTFFRQFCGGETAEECLARMDRLAQSGIQCILDLSVEADLHLEQSDVPQMYDELAQPLGKWWRQEQSADVVLAMTEQCVHTAARGGGGDGGAFAAIKVTAFAPPELLLRLNQVITEIEHVFQAHQVDGYVGIQALQDVVAQVLPRAQSVQQEHQRQALIQYMHEHQPQIDAITFAQVFNLQGPSRDVWWSSTADEQSALLGQDELEAYDRMVNRLDQVCSLAHRHHVGIMVDAEQSYFQEVIDHVAMNLQVKYNRRDEQDHAPTVYNTYQMYTKASQAKLERDVELARRENIAFAAKLVRGAYMVSERKRAIQLGYPSPIHDTLEDTHTSFNDGVRFLLGRLHDHQESTHQTLSATTAPIVFMVASHNRDSIIQTVQEMDRQGVRPSSGVVHFGQLFGMQDQISYSLGKNGYSIYKYLPYGMIDEVIPYLLRRAQENQAVMGSVNKERRLMWLEVKDRMRGLAVPAPAVMTAGAPASTATAVDEAESPIQSTAA